MAEQQRTFFVLGGTVAGSELRDMSMKKGEHQAKRTRFGRDQLQYMIGCYDHQRQQVSRPVVVYDKWCGDAHDNPVMTIDPEGHLWVLGPSHGEYTTESFMSRSQSAYDFHHFDHHHVPLFAYPQTLVDLARICPLSHSLQQASAWPMVYPGARPLTPQREIHLAHIERGSYQVSASHQQRLGTVFNMHPNKGGLEARRNLYYLQTDDGGQTWTNAQGEAVLLPLTKEDNPALVLSTRSPR